MNVVFFDDICILCNRTVSFLIGLDSSRLLRYAAVNGKLAKSLEIKFEELAPEAQSIIFKDNNGVIFYRSDAVIEIISLLISPKLKILKFIPLFIRDSLYRLIAKYRYQLFGKANECRIVSGKEKDLFLD